MHPWEDLSLETLALGRQWALRNTDPDSKSGAQRCYSSSWLSRLQLLHADPCKMYMVVEPLMPARQPQDVLTIRDFRYTIPFQGFQWFTESISFFLSSWSFWVCRKRSKVSLNTTLALFHFGKTLYPPRPCLPTVHTDITFSGSSPDELAEISQLTGTAAHVQETQHLDIQCAVCLHTVGWVLGNQAGILCSGPQRGPTRV